MDKLKFKLCMYSNKCACHLKHTSNHSCANHLPFESARSSHGRNTVSLPELQFQTLLISLSRFLPDAIAVPSGAIVGAAVECLLLSLFVTVAIVVSIFSVLRYCKRSGPPSNKKTASCEAVQSDRAQTQPAQHASLSNI